MELEHLFDESHNKVEKQWQMDLLIRFWDTSEDIVTTRYYSSEYLGKVAAADICLKFEKWSVQVSWIKISLPFFSQKLI